MNKQELINAVAKNAKQTKAAAAQAVEAFLKSVKDALRKGDEVRLIGFGTFKKGRICLQDHDNTVWYRNVKLSPLP